MRATYCARRTRSPSPAVAISGQADFWVNLGTGVTTPDAHLGVGLVEAGAGVVDVLARDRAGPRRLAHAIEEGLRPVALGLGAREEVL